MPCFYTKGFLSMRAVALQLCILGGLLTARSVSSLSTSARLLPRRPVSPLSRSAVPARADGQRSLSHCFGTTVSSCQSIPRISTTPWGLSSSAGSSDSSDASVLDRLLGKGTSAFPLFVLASAILGIAKPQTLTWVNQGNLISVMLASVMCGTGLTLEMHDFKTVFQKDWGSVPLGVLCQFLIMPLAAFVVGRTFLFSSGPTGPSLFLGLCLVGCSPGGTASNLVSLIAQADVALSVILTTCSTVLAVLATPLLVKLLVGSTVTVSGVALVQATARVVLLPVLLGMILNAKLPRLARFLSRFTPFASVLLVSLICGGVVAQNASMLLHSPASAANLSVIGVAVLMLHSLGFAAGYLIPKFLFGKSERSSRTIAIEVGMQNSALAVVLARSIGAPPIASLPGALSATAHSCLGSLLAAYWRIKGDPDGDGVGKDVSEEPFPFQHPSLRIYDLGYGDKTVK